MNEDMKSNDILAIKILDNCCSPAYLDYLKRVAFDSENWNMIYPPGNSIEDKFLKLDIIDGGVKHPFLVGLAMGLLMQIHEAGGQGLFLSHHIHFCGISMKDKHTSNNIHKDSGKEDNLVKVLGILNSDWEEEWGGGFFYNGISNYIKPTSFCIFDPAEPHANEEIFTDKKRIAIDFTVFKDQQSLKRYITNHNQ